MCPIVFWIIWWLIASFTKTCLIVFTLLPLVNFISHWRHNLLSKSVREHQNCKKQLKIKFLFFWSKVAIYFSLGLVGGIKLQKFSALKENIQHFEKIKFITFFCGSFFPAGSGSGSRDPIESRSRSATLPRTYGRVSDQDLDRIRFYCNLENGF
jgi:hypothetical protein